MASALITIDQLANPVPVGTAGEARDDILISQPVTLRNANDTDVNRWIWTLKDAPIPSALVAGTVFTTAQVSFTPDATGTYRWELKVNDGAATGEVDRRIVGVRDGLGRLYPAADQEAAEANYDVGGSPNEVNWAKEVERILRSLGAPQLLSAAQSDGVAVAGSVNVFVGAIGLPQSSAEVTGYDFVDINPAPPNAGPAPTVNGESFAVSTGVNGLASICVATVDLDTSGTTIGDVWALIMITGTTPLLLSKLTIV